MTYVPSPYPEDYPTRDVFKGVNIYTTVPNRYPYMYDRQPYPSLYYNDTNPNFIASANPLLAQHQMRARSTPKVFPYTNRPWPDYTIYGKPECYESLLDDRNLRPAYSFYKCPYGQEC